MNYELLPEFIELKGNARSRAVWLNDKPLSEKESQLMRNHSPDGFNWGYGGSGPAQLALAILLRTMEVDDAMRLYQSFKFRVIAHIEQGEDFQLFIPLRKIIKDIDLSK